MKLLKSPVHTCNYKVSKHEMWPKFASRYLFTGSTYQNDISNGQHQWDLYECTLCVLKPRRICGTHFCSLIELCAVFGHYYRKLSPDPFEQTIEIANIVKRKAIINAGFCSMQLNQARMQKSFHSCWWHVGFVEALQSDNPAVITWIPYDQWWICF